MLIAAPACFIRQFFGFHMLEQGSERVGLSREVSQSSDSHSRVLGGVSAPAFVGSKGIAIIIEHQCIAAA